MGNLEKISKKRAGRQNLQKVVLATVNVAGALALGLVMPKTIRMFKSLGYDPGNRRTEGIKRARENLVRKGMLVHKDGFLELTEKGKIYLGMLQLEDNKNKKPKKWDGQWRMLIFDIPEYRKNLRDKIRATLMHIGFLKVQNSVWIYPYDCEDLIALLKADFKVGKDLLYVIVNSIENDKSLRHAFGLPQAF